MKTTHCASLCLALLLFACEEGDSEASQLERPRVLGVRFEVRDDPQRASPEAGEEVDIRWLVRGPKGAAEVDYVLSACASTGRSSGLPACSGPVFSQAHDRGEQPTLSLRVPVDYSAAQDGGKPILLAGAMCEHGEASFDLRSMLGRCEGSAEVPETFSAYLDVGEDNLNPDLQGASLTFAGESWPETTALPCPELSSPAKGPVAIELRLSASARETVASMTEPLRVTQFTTLGAFSRLFSLVDPESPAPRVELAWSPPKIPKGEGEDMRVMVVVRDQRGGTSWFERCALWRPEAKGEE